MASNIKIVGNIINTETVSRYSSQDTNLIASRNLQENFGGTGDYIEYFIVIILDSARIICLDKLGRTRIIWYSN